MFAGAEIAVVTVRRTRLGELADAGNRRAHAVERLRSNPDRFFATVQIGITVVGASAAALGGASLAADLAPKLRSLGLEGAADPVALALVVGGISFLSLVLGELVPKSLGIRFAEGYALLIAPPLVGLGKIAQPLVWFLTASSNLVLRIFGDRTTFAEGRMSAEELQQLVEDAARSGSVTTQTGEIASRAFDLENVAVASVMVPRNRIVALDQTLAIEELRDQVLEIGHSRIPVTNGTIDEIVGYIVAKDLLLVMAGKARFAEILRPAYFVPETMRALDALKEMQRRQLQMAIVVNERGTVAGLLTVEDLLEELVGEILSEHELPVELAERQQDGSYVASGGVPLRDLNRALRLDLQEGEGFTTLAGLCIALSGRIPEPGATFVAQDGTKLEVLEASPRRVRRVRVIPPSTQEAEPPPREGGVPPGETTH